MVSHALRSAGSHEATNSGGVVVVEAQPDNNRAANTANAVKPCIRKINFQSRCGARTQRPTLRDRHSKSKLTDTLA
jgi:hypothetical protein